MTSQEALSVSCNRINGSEHKSKEKKKEDLEIKKTLNLYLGLFSKITSHQRSFVVV